MPPGAPVTSAPVDAATLAAPPCRLPARDDVKWFREEVHSHEGMLKRWLRGKFPGLRDIDDLVHDVYLRLWKRQKRKPIEQTKSFLFTSARNLALTHLRRHDISPVADVGDFEQLEVLAEGPGSAEETCRREETELLLQAIDLLPNRAREVYLLRKFEGYSLKEISEKLGISMKTIENQITRANKVCERFLRERGVLPEDES